MRLKEILILVGIILFISGCGYTNNFQLTEKVLADSLEFNEKGTNYNILDKERIAAISMPYIQPYPGYAYQEILESEIMERGSVSSGIYNFRVGYKFAIDKKEELDHYGFNFEYNSKDDSYSVIEEGIFITRMAVPDSVKKEAFNLAKTDPEISAYLSVSKKDDYQEKTYRWYLNADELKKDFNFGEYTDGLWVAIILGYSNAGEPFPYLVLVNLEQSQVVTGGAFKYPQPN